MPKDHIAFIINHRNYRFIKAACFDRHIGAALAFGTKGFESLAADTFNRGNRISANALVRLWMLCLQPGVTRTKSACCGNTCGTNFGAVVHDMAHHLGAARNDEVFHTRHHLSRRKACRSDTAATKTVERDA